jgi:hypothetical protein
MMAADALQLDAARHVASTLPGLIASAVADHLCQRPDAVGRRPAERVQRVLERFSTDEGLVRHMAALAVAGDGGAGITPVLEAAGVVEAARAVAALPRNALPSATAHLAAHHPEAVQPLITIALRRSALSAHWAVPPLAAAAAARCAEAGSEEVQAMAREALLALGDITDTASSPRSPLLHEHIHSSVDPFAPPWAAAFAPRQDDAHAGAHLAARSHGGGAVAAGVGGGEEGGEEGGGEHAEDRRLEEMVAVEALAGLVGDPCPCPKSYTLDPKTYPTP